MGVTPFFNLDEKVITKKIVNGKLCFPNKKKYNISYSDEIVDLLSGLLTKSPAERLGS